MITESYYYILARLGFYKQTTHIHTHPFNGPLSGTTRVSRYQKGKTSLDFTEARGSEWQWHQLGHMQVYTSLQTDTMPAPHRSVFYRPDAKVKGKVFPYSLPSVGPGADPGVQAVSPQVT